MFKSLSNSEAKENLKKFGYNELPSAKSKNIFLIALEVMKEPMFLLLLSCASLYILLGDYNEGIILLSSVLLIISITFFQHQKTEKSLDALRQLSSPRALVIRDGKEIRIPGREVVPGDLILLAEGDRIPADAEIIESNYLTVDESLLSGESLAVIKNKNTDDESVYVYSGTLVVQGSAKAIVLHTGVNTQFGKIGKSLQSIEKGQTKLQLEMKLLIRNLFIGGAIISIGVVVIFYLKRGDFINSLLNGLAASMAILPEEFPVVLTIFLALGAWRLSKKKVLTRNASAIETLGSATVLCTDKTGTITQNRMQVAGMYYGNQTYLKNEFLSKQQELTEVLETFYFASSFDSIDPMEIAIANEYKILKKENEFNLIKEYPLSKSLFAMTRVIEFSNNHKKIAYCKGAPEAILKLCKVTESEYQNYLSIVREFASSGLRVLASASTEINMIDLPDEQTGIDYKFVGLIAFEDPIRDEVPQAIKECNEAGIKVIMITGDYPETAKSIATQIGLSHNNIVITGDDIKKMSDIELTEKIKHTHIFARIIPEQKLKIIQALKSLGEIVAMTGDGVNDAPALKAADIGIAMGQKGTDVAREASSLVLLDDNFASIVSAIRLGRRIFDNLQKAMSYILAIHIPIIGLVMLPSVFSTLPILLMPLHIVFMELIIDPICSIAFESEQEEKSIMKRKPRDVNEKFFGWNKIIYSLFEGLLVLSVVLVVYFMSINEGHSDQEVRAISFSSLIIANVFLILTSLSKTRSFISVLSEKNWAVILIISIALIMLFLTMRIPFLQNIFSFEFPGYIHFISSVSIAFIMLIILECIKYLKLFMPTKFS